MLVWMRLHVYIKSTVYISMSANIILKIIVLNIQISNIKNQNIFF